MKSSSHPFHKRSIFGYHYENLLKATLERVVGEPIVKTSEEYDTMDFQGNTSFLELKARSDQYHYSQSFIKKQGWLLPYCKIQRAKEEVAKGKRVVFFYFWKADKTLWMWEYSEEALTDCIIKYPDWHIDQQQQIYVKEMHWKKVN